MTIQADDVLAGTVHNQANVALVMSLQRVGGFVKVDVRLATSERMTVQLSRGEADALRLKEGDRVLVDLGDAKVFLEDYSI